MARTALTPQQIERTGRTPSYSAGDAANGHAFVNDGQMFVHIKNAGAGSINATFSLPNQVDGLSVASRVVAVTNAQERMIGPFPPNLYNQADGTVYLDLSGATSVTLAVFRL